MFKTKVLNWIASSALHCFFIIVDEDAVGKMITMMEDKELIGSFPLLAQVFCYISLAKEKPYDFGAFFIYLR